MLQRSVIAIDKFHIGRYDTTDQNELIASMIPLTNWIVELVILIQRNTAEFLKQHQSTTSEDDNVYMPPSLQMLYCIQFIRVPKILVVILDILKHGNAFISYFEKKSLRSIFDTDPPLIKLEQMAHVYHLVHHLKTNAEQYLKAIKNMDHVAPIPNHPPFIDGLKRIFAMECALQVGLLLPNVTTAHLISNLNLEPSFRGCLSIAKDAKQFRSAIISPPYDGVTRSMITPMSIQGRGYKVCKK